VDGRKEVKMFILENWETIDALLTLLLGWAGGIVQEKRSNKKRGE
jgi:hypothetical protein